MIETNVIYLSDNLTKLREMPDNSVDTIITDSPYGLGKPPKMDEFVKMLIAWTTVGYWEIKGKGFMGKSWDAYVPQPILWKECYRVLKPGGHLLSFFGTRTYHVGALAIAIAGFEIRDCIQWIYGSGFPKSKASLKPANEPICVARKPGGIGLLNIDDARIEVSANDPELDINRKSPRMGATIGGNGKYGGGEVMTTSLNANGRWPSNVIFDEECAILLDEQSGILVSGTKKKGTPYNHSSCTTMGASTGCVTKDYIGDVGGASRFFYVAKASPSERNGSKHPTIKPVKLMRHLVKLYVPIGGICMDVHCGSGPTIEACILEGRPYIGIDNDAESVTDTQKRIDKHSNKLFKHT